MQIKGNTELKKRTILFAIIFSIVFVTELIVCKNGSGDDKVFSEALKDQSLKTFLEGRYQWWTSRVFVEFIMMPFQVYWQKLWYVVNALISTAIVMYSGLLIEKKKNAASVISVFVAMLFLIPVNAYGGSGWITCTTNYLWVLFYSLVALYPLIKECRGEKINVFIYILSLLSSFFAMNNEQAAAILLGVIIVGLVYLLVDRRKLSLWLLPTLLINIFMIVFDLRAMGNAVRLAYETNRYMPEFADFSMPEKILNGITNTGFVYMNCNGKQYIFWALAIVLSVCGFMKIKGRPVMRLLPSAPLVMLVIPRLLFLLFRLGVWNRFLRFLELLWFNRLYTATNGGLLAIAQVVFYILTFVLFVITIMVCAGSATEGILHSIGFLAAVCSACILGFSPTILESGERIFFFGDYLLIIVLIRVVFNTVKSLKTKNNE